MSTLWFFTPNTGEVGEHIMLDDAEARHAAGSRRLAGGEMVTLFDGHGCVMEGKLTVSEVKRKSASVEIVNVQHLERATPVIHVGFAVPKGDRLSTLLDMCTQAGADSFTPIMFERSVVKPPELDGGKHTRLSRIIVEACKQSRRAFVPVLNPASTPMEFVRTIAARVGRLLLADVRGLPITAALAAAASASEIAIFIGPEGGCSEAEVESLTASGAELVWLGESILRIETAAVLACGMIAGSSLRREAGL